MKKLMFLGCSVFFILGFLISVASAYDTNTPTLWFDVIGETDCSVTTAPGGGDQVPDPNYTLTPGKKVWVNVYLSGIAKDGSGNDELGVNAWDFRLSYSSSQFVWNPPTDPSIDVDEITWPIVLAESNDTENLILAAAAADFFQTVGRTGDDLLLFTMDLCCNGTGVEIFDFSEGSELLDIRTPEDGTTPPQQISVTVESLTVTNETASNIDVDPSSLDFGNVVVSECSSDNKTVTITNMGTENITFNSIGITAGNSFFSMTDNNCTSPLAPGDSCAVKVGFCCSEDPGVRDGNMTINSDDPNDPIVIVPLEGECFEQNAVQMVMPRLWPCTPPYHWWFENPDQYSEGAQSAHPSMTATPNEEVCFYINYDAFDDNGDREKELSGISFWVSYDNTLLTISDPEKDIKHIFPKGYVNVLNAPEIICDGDNCKFLMAWADPSSPPAWPNEPLPLEILKVCFMVPSDVNPGLEGVNATITFSNDPHTAVGYGFYSEDMKVKIVNFNIDIDNNGSVEPLTDGLLITRYLFGFMGNNLVSGAVDPLGARTSPSAIADWIERGRVEPSPGNNNYTHLDIDANTEVTALTDGIMLIRHLFGYTGDNLIAGALGPNATQFDAGQIVTYINSLK